MLKKDETMENPIKEFTITRTFDAPRELVWKAWTDQKLIQKWWGPRGVTNPTCEWDARSGGKINIVMLAGKELGQFEGMKWPMNGVFREVTPQSRIVFSGNALDEVQDILLESLVTVDFEAIGQKTRMNLRFEVTKATAKAEFAIKGAEAGWNQQIDKLAEMLKM